MSRRNSVPAVMGMSNYNNGIGPDGKPLLDYIDRHIVSQSQLDDRVKQAYIKRAEELERAFGGYTYDDNELLRISSEWRALSIHFYENAGIEGEIWSIWPEGWETWNQPIDLGISETDTPNEVANNLAEMEDVEPEPVSTAEIRTWLAETDAEVQAPVNRISGESQPDSHDEAIRELFQNRNDIKEAGPVSRFEVVFRPAKESSSAQGEGF